MYRGYQTPKKGRKREEFSEDFFEKIQELAELGCNITQICDHLRIGRTTFYERSREDERFREAYHKGKADGLIETLKLLKEFRNKGHYQANIDFLKRYDWGGTAHQLEAINDLSQEEKANLPALNVSFITKKY